jgi:DNA-binding MarR family transcriptional regulator
MQTPENSSVPAGLSRESTAAAHFFRFELYRRLADQRSRLGIANQRLLWLFRDGQGRTLREVAETLELEQSTVNRQVNAALDAGLLRRYSEGGRAARLVTMTDEGLAAFTTDVAEALAAYQAGLDALGDDADRFVAQLSGFVDAYGEAVHAQPAR